jgi:hypothetical protein
MLGNEHDNAEAGARPNDEERDQPHVPMRLSLARSSSSLTSPFRRFVGQAGLRNNCIYCHIGMKTTSKFLVLIGLLVGVLGVVFPTVLHGDSWQWPSVVTACSPSSSYIAQVTPGSGFGSYERAITNREDNAIVIVSVRPAPGITNLVWSGKLINPVAPVHVYVSDGGYLVTMDNWHNVGYGPVIAIYDPKGRLLRHWSLDELFTPEERGQFIHSVSSISWHSGAIFGRGAETNLLIVPAQILPDPAEAWGYPNPVSLPAPLLPQPIAVPATGKRSRPEGKELRFTLRNATLLTPPAAPGNAEPDSAARRSQPVRSETNQPPAAAGSGR